MVCVREAVEAAAIVNNPGPPTPWRVRPTSALADTAGKLSKSANAEAATRLLKTTSETPGQHRPGPERQRVVRRGEVGVERMWAARTTDEHRDPNRERKDEGAERRLEMDRHLSTTGRWTNEVASQAELRNEATKRVQVRS